MGCYLLCSSLMNTSQFLRTNVLIPNSSPRLRRNLQLDQNKKEGFLSWAQDALLANPSPVDNTALKQICTYFSGFCVIFKCTHIILSKSWLKFHGLWFILKLWAICEFLNYWAKLTFVYLRKGRRTWGCWCWALNSINQDKGYPTVSARATANVWGWKIQRSPQSRVMG